MQDIAIDDLPGVLRLIAELIGVEKCREIIHRFGGGRIFISKSGVAANHELRSFLSDRDCLLIGKYLKGEQLAIPRAKTALCVARNREIWRDSEAGLSTRQLAQKYDLCDRHILDAIGSYEKKLRDISATSKSKQDITV
jgi:Mor family transcriptional regulator